MRAAWILAGVLPLAIAASSPTRPAAQRSALKPTGVIELLSWLPADTETVVVTQTPARPRNGPLFEVKNLAEIDFGDTTLGATTKHVFRDFSVKASVEGSRHFRPPTEFGEMRYEGATLFVLDKPLGSHATIVMSELRKGTGPTISVEGTEVVRLREKLEKDLWTFYIAIARPDVVVVATDRNYLSEVLRRRSGNGSPRALPATLPEWQWVNTSAPYWALRHYRRDRGDGDPSSPFVRNGSAGVFDDDAIGLTASATDDGRTFVVHYLSTSKAAKAVVEEIWKHPADGVDPEIRAVAENVTEVRFTPASADGVRGFFFFLFAALGHAIYV